MILRTKHLLGLLLALGLWCALAPAYAADESLVNAFLAKRQTLVDANQVDINAMSREIRAAIADGERLEREGKYGLALERLLRLQSFGPLAELPSFDVQMLSSWLYMKTGDSARNADHKARADAMRELLQRRIGDGTSPETPVRAIMNSDVSEWARMQLTTISEVKAYPFKGRELLVITYSGTLTGNKPALAYFEIDPRVRSRLQLSVYAPIPLEDMKPEYRSLFDQAKVRREKFLSDTTFPYLALLDKVKTSLAKATQFDKEGKPEQAMSALKEIEALRPIEDIPLPQLIGAYSFLNGKLGNTQKQVELRGLLFGINQAIAHSGDGLSSETAVHVIAIDEEYDWLRDKKLVRTLQKVVETSSGKLDVITAKSADGAERDYHFNITRMYSKYSQGFGDVIAK